MNMVKVTLKNNNKHGRFNGRRFPKEVTVEVAVNPRKGIEDAVIAACKLAQSRFGKVKLVRFTS